VQAVGAVSILPLSSNRSDRLFEIEGREQNDEKSERPPDEYRVITPDYLQAMGIPLLKGRSIEMTDRTDGAPVLIVSQAFERHWLPEGAVGHRVRLVSPATPWATIVGVVGDVHDFGLDATVHGAMYYPLSQAASEEMSFTIRSACTAWWPIRFGSAPGRSACGWRSARIPAASWPWSPGRADGCWGSACSPEPSAR
jgi:putative ABC transport system permease protein